MNVSDLMQGSPMPDEADPSVAFPGDENSEDAEEAQTMAVLTEEFRTAPVEQAVDALDQLVRILIRKYV